MAFETVTGLIQIVHHHPSMTTAAWKSRHPMMRSSFPLFCSRLEENGKEEDETEIIMSGSTSSGSVMSQGLENSVASFIVAAMISTMSAGALLTWQPDAALASSLTKQDVQDIVQEIVTDSEKRLINRIDELDTKITDSEKRLINKIDELRNNAFYTTLIATAFSSLKVEQIKSEIKKDHAAVLKEKTYRAGQRGTVVGTVVCLLTLMVALQIHR